MIFLETDRLLLRNVITDDVDIMFDYRNNEICSRYQRGQTKTYNGIEDLVQNAPWNNHTVKTIRLN